MNTHNHHNEHHEIQHLVIHLINGTNDQVVNIDIPTPIIEQNFEPEPQPSYIDRINGFIEEAAYLAMKLNIIYPVAAPILLCSYPYIRDFAANILGAMKDPFDITDVFEN